MKEVWYFLQWQWRQFEFWQKCWIFAMGLVGAGLTASPERRMYFIGAGGAIFLLFMLKWVFWDGTKQAWNNYQEEKNKVIRILAAEEERSVK